MSKSGSKGAIRSAKGPPGSGKGLPGNAKGEGKVPAGPETRGRLLLLLSKRPLRVPLDDRILVYLTVLACKNGDGGVCETIQIQDPKPSPI